MIGASNQFHSAAGEARIRVVAVPDAGDRYTVLVTVTAVSAECPRGERGVLVKIALVGCFELRVEFLANRQVVVIVTRDYGEEVRRREPVGRTGGGGVAKIIVVIIAPTGLSRQRDRRQQSNQKEPSHDGFPDERQMRHQCPASCASDFDRRSGVMNTTTSVLIGRIVGG